MSNEATDLLRSIDATLKQVVSLLQRSLPPEIAPDSDLDGQYGDELVKSKPRDWTGPWHGDTRMSEMPVELLNLIANRADYFAAKNEAEGNVTDSGKPKSMFDRRTAARARGWAARMAKGWKAPERKPAGDLDGAGEPGDEIGF